jgi:hypothetical protein
MLEKLMEYPIFVDMLVVLLTALGGYLLTYINKKKVALQQEMDNALLTKYTDMLEDTVRACVLTTNQTFVETLKKQGTFDEAAQKEAFTRTYDNVMSILNEDCYEFLIEITGDIEVFITNKIEAEVNWAK